MFENVAKALLLIKRIHNTYMYTFKGQGFESCVARICLQGIKSGERETGKEAEFCCSDRLT